MKRAHILIFNAKLAKQLLKSGYTISDIKPNRDLPNASVFVFLNEDGLLSKVNEFKKG